MACSNPSDGVLRSVALALVLLAGASLAAESVEAQARRIATEGKAAFDTNDFDTAISKYEAAYRLKAAPGLLFNLGQCYRKKGALEPARSYFKRYLETSPPEAQARATETLLTELESQLKAQHDAELRARAEQAERERVEAERQRAEEQARANELRVSAARAEAEAAQRKLELELTRREEVRAAPTPITGRWWFWAGIATVVVAGAATATAVATAPRPTMTSFPDINAR